VKVGIVVPYSWSFWGGVVEHAEAQARALEQLGVETRTLVGMDPPGSFSRALHPRQGRAGPAPPGVVALGRSVIVPGNAALSNLVLSPSTLPRLRRTLAREHFDLLHVHEPLAPMIGPAALALWEGPTVATFHAAGASAWRPIALRCWGFLLDRIDVRIAVSDQARQTAAGYAPGSYELLPNGIELPDAADPAGRLDQVLFVGRHERRKGLPVLLRAWPEIRRRTGARLRVVGADPLAVRLLLRRLRVSEDGMDLLGIVDEDTLAAELATAKLLVAPSLGNESFGMVVLRAFASATPVVASDIDAYRAVVAPEAGLLVPVADAEALAAGVVSALEDEAAREDRGAAARELAGRYAWPKLARELVVHYESALAG